jgi:hypothetical protein
VVRSRTDASTDDRCADAAPSDGYDALPNPFIEAIEFDVSTSSRLWVAPGSARGGSLNKKLADLRPGRRGSWWPAWAVHPSQILQALNMLVITEQFALPRAHQAFDTDGRLADARQNEQVTKVVQRLIDVAGRLA